MPNPTAAIIVIGDEILSGRTRDSNMHFLAGQLSAAGIDLKEARMIGDDREQIIATVNALREIYDHVFTSGGIGPTHDDITADCVAAAFGLPLDVRADARDLLLNFYSARGQELNGPRLRMARIPEGALLIDNPISIAPGFSLANVHVMAGVPSVFEAMVASLLPRLTGGSPLLSETVRFEVGEGYIAEPLTALAARYTDLSIGSYPFLQNGLYGTNIVVRGHDAARIAAAVTELRMMIPT